MNIQEFISNGYAIITAVAAAVIFIFQHYYWCDKF